MLACAGDPARLTYKQSRRGDAEIDRVMRHVLAASGRARTASSTSRRTATTSGSSARPGSISASARSRRTPYAGFPEYHTSADNLDFVSPEAMADTLARLPRDRSPCSTRNRRYVNLSPYGEPQLGRRGLYDALGGRSDTKQAQMAMLWVLNLSDGEHSLLDVAERPGCPSTPSPPRPTPCTAPG